MTRIVPILSRVSQRIFPKKIYNMLRRSFYFFLGKYYLKFGRPYHPAETTKARHRRLVEGFFDKYCRGKGLDVGCGGDPIMPDVVMWDFEHGDAQYLKGIENETFDYVNASHILEHMVDPATALKNWFRVLKKGGYLILYVPHRDLYEKKKTLPSRWNADHKHFFLPDTEEAPNTSSLKKLIKNNLSGAEVIYMKVCDQGHTITDPMKRSDGEYSIEVVIKKN
jgi:SAM-dependent methyltransferase